MNSETHAVEQDLEYVRKALRRDGRGPFPRPVALLWAAITLAGFTLLDFAPHQAPPFWAVAGPAGFALTVWLSKRSSHAGGAADREEAARWTSHWLGLSLAIALVVVASLGGRLSWDTTGATILILLALAYYTAGIHLHRGLLPLAAVLAAGYLLVLFVDGRVWTWLGAATAAALVASTFVGSAPRRA